MKKMGRFIPILIGFALLLPAGAAVAFNEGSDKAETDQFKQMLRQRELEKERSRQKLIEREQSKPAPKKVARIHRKGTDPTNSGEDTVVTTVELTDEEVRNHDWKRVMAAAQAQRPPDSVGESGSRSGRRSSGFSEAQLNWIICGFALLAGGAWWFMRRPEAV